MRRLCGMRIVEESSRSTIWNPGFLGWVWGWVHLLYLGIAAYTLSRSVIALVEERYLIRGVRRRLEGVLEGECNGPGRATRRRQGRLHRGNQGREDKEGGREFGRIEDGGGAGTIGKFEHVFCFLL